MIKKRSSTTEVVVVLAAGGDGDGWSSCGDDPSGKASKIGKGPPIGLILPWFFSPAASFSFDIRIHLGERTLAGTHVDCCSIFLFIHSLLIAAIPCVLTINLRMNHCCVHLLDVQPFTPSFEQVVHELGSIVGDNDIWYAESAQQWLILKLMVWWNEQTRALMEERQ
ncbi:hypothetical protein Tco_0024168 [Tanacetum coccineum]